MFSISWRTRAVSPVRYILAVSEKVHFLSSLSFMVSSNMYNLVVLGVLVALVLEVVLVVSAAWAVVVPLAY